MKMIKISRILLLIISLITISCASSSVTRVGSETFAPLPETTHISVFSKETEIKKPFKTIGIVSYTNPGKYQILTLEDAIPELKNKARASGANAIIIDETAPVKSGIISTGISVKARAILVSE